MRPLVVVGILGALLSARPAEACHTGSQIAVVLIGVGQVGINAPFTIHDLVVSESSRGYAITEMAVMTPTVLVGGAVAITAFGECDEGGSMYPNATPGQRLFTAGMVGWSAALLVHGIYVIARPRAAPPPVAVVPMTVESELVGFGIAGRF